MMENKYIYYKLSKSENFTLIPLAKEYKLRVHIPTLTKLNLHSKLKPIYLFWYFITFNRYSIYYVFDENNNIVHFSHVMPKIFKYAFMKKKKSIHIGPCWTNENHRGKRIYPAVLSKICADNNDKNIYIFTEKNNVASQRGLERVGFKMLATGFKTNKLGIYKIK